MARVVSVTELTKYLASLLGGDSALKSLVVRGEISNFKRYSSGHCYFVLKDQGAIIPCVMFKSSAQGMRFQPKDGMQVLASGSINVYAEGGKYQLYVRNMAPDGVGDLALAFEQLKERLTQEGLFGEAHKQSLPQYPKTIGIVTSPTGAVLRDIYRVSKGRFPAIKLVLKPVQVQGSGAAEQIAAAIDFFNERYPVDVLIVGRGGGSMEDLWSFNEEVVVRAIYRSRIPIISAVGHETDFTLADFAADKRAATPSQAAEFAVRDVREINGYLQQLRQRMAGALQNQVQHKRLQLQALLNSTALKQPHGLLEYRQQRADLLRERLQLSIERQLQERKQHVYHLMEKLELVNPMAVLRRGYGLVKDQQGKLITDIDKVMQDDIVSVQLAAGRLKARVLKVEPDMEAAASTMEKEV